MLGKLYHVKAEATASAEQWHHTLQWQPTDHLASNRQADFKQLTIHNAQVQGFEGDALVSIDNLTLNEGDRVQLVGASGTGKTVLFDALANLRIITGQLSINDELTANLSLLQKNVFYLEQRPVFFNGTLRENLGLGEVDDDRIIHAIADIGLADWFAELADGLDTVLEEHTNLSGGQKQKLALARIIIFDVPIVLLDEPFAHLTEHEQTELFDLLVRVTQGRTSVWISHRIMNDEPFNKQWHLSEQGHVSEKVL
jgi:ATP-binding cassette subfamily C protein CydD